MCQITSFLFQLTIGKVIKKYHFTGEGYIHVSTDNNVNWRWGIQENKNLIQFSYQAEDVFKL